MAHGCGEIREPGWRVDQVLAVPPGQRRDVDHVLASRALLASLEHSEIHNEYLPDKSGVFRTDVKFPESDHAPVVAQFTLVTLRRGVGTHLSGSEALPYAT
jgi:exonuclease III